MKIIFARGTLILLDLLCLSIAYWLAFLLRFEFTLSLHTVKLLFFTWPYVLIFQYSLLVISGVTRFAWRYVGVREAVRILLVLGTASAVLTALRLGLAPLGGYTRYLVIPLGVLAVHFILSFMSIAGVRLLRRILAERQERVRRRPLRTESKRTLLVGAGQAGVLVAKEVEQNPQMGIEVVGFVDDDPQKVGTVIQGIKVLGDTASLELLMAQTEAEQAVISIASAPGRAIRAIVEACNTADLPVRIIPGISEILEGKVGISRIREVRIEDLLGREAVELDHLELARFIEGRRVLVTGAGGSIGSELCRQACNFGIDKLILVEQAENALFLIHSEIKKSFPQLEVFPVICDVCDSHRVEQVFSEHEPQVVLHAAAHKHVPMMEWNPGEAIKNNVFGTKTVADAADRHGCEAFVMISTDKAVRPSSIMGATKRAAEVYIQAIAQQSRTTFVAVRFGNVLGSAGSVIPIFKEQILQGGPVTVTHPEMTRYFMTIPEACQLVLQAASMGEGGEIFVLDMGQPVKIVDLASDLIRLSGFDLDEIGIEFTGPRPGEKLFEELHTDGEHMDTTRHPKIFIGRIERRSCTEVESNLSSLVQNTDLTSAREVRAALRLLVPEMVEPLGPTMAETPSSENGRVPTLH